MSERPKNYLPNRISRLMEPLVAVYRRNFGSTPIWFVALIVIVGPLWFWLLIEALDEVWTLVTGSPQEGAGKDIADANRNRVQAIFFGIGIIGALLAAIVVPVRLWLQNRQTITAEQGHITAEQGHITDRLNKAIEMLGTEKTVQLVERNVRYQLMIDGEPKLFEKLESADDDPVEIPEGALNIERDKWESTAQTKPNLEVRLGAIYALERIAQDSERDHLTVMETLCAYIRENAPAGEVRPHGLGEIPDYLTGMERVENLERRKDKLRVWTRDLPAC